jgi:hypothetical protein
VIPFIFAAMFGAPILRGKSFALYDAFAYSYPLRTVAWNELRHGRLPLWTPLIMSGYPLLSMAQLALGYPLTWGYIFARLRRGTSLRARAVFADADFRLRLRARDRAQPLGLLARRTQLRLRRLGHHGFSA